MLQVDSQVVSSDAVPPSSSVPSGPPSAQLAAVARLAGAVPRPRREPLALLVVRGPDTGATLSLGPEPRVIGRSRDVDMMLRDRCVSRRHLEVTLVEGGVRLTVSEGAAPFVLGAEERMTAVVAAGEQVILGDTVLRVQRAQDETTTNPAVRAIASEDARALLTGATLDVRGLAAVLALVEALDALTHVEEAPACVAAWAQARIGASTASLVSLGTLPASREELLLHRPHDVVYFPRTAQGSTVVCVPSHGQTLGWLILELAEGADRLTEAARCLLVVAGRVIASSVARLRALQALKEDSSSFRQQALGSAAAFLGRSPAATRVAGLVSRISRSDATVLLRGETGTGKTFVARLIHESGPRAREPFRVINCAAIPESLLESELFGHERGAFTGAVTSRAGAFEAAGDGTVFLDEIGEMPLASQAKLLRVLEERRFERLGSNRSIALGARIIAATNRDLQAMCRDGRFRTDLLFRISVVNVDVPALRERGDDVVVLARQILGDLAPSASRRVLDFAPCALEAIRKHDWPGNVRELRNAIESAVVLGDGPLVRAEDLPSFVRGGVVAPVGAVVDDPFLVRLPSSLADLETKAIEAALKACGGNRTRAAATLGINRVTLYKKLKGGILDGDAPTDAVDPGAEAGCPNAAS